MLKEKLPSTISKDYLPTLRSLLRWATEKVIMQDNPAASIRLASQRAVQNRERGYTTAEATALLQAVYSYQPR